MDKPVSIATFAAGKLQRYSEKRKLKFGETDLEFYTVPSSVSTLKEDFVLAEFGNALEYFSEYFGLPYPLPKLPGRSSSILIWSRTTNTTDDSPRGYSR